MNPAEFLAKCANNGQGFAAPPGQACKNTRYITACIAPGDSPAGSSQCPYGTLCANLSPCDAGKAHFAALNRQ